MDGFVSINGVVFPLASAKIPVLDRGFLFGDGVFEVLAAFDGKVIALEAHLERLRESAKCIGIKLPWSQRELVEEISQLCRLKKYPKTYVRVVITRGDGLGLNSPSAVPRRVIYVLPAPVFSNDIYKIGLTLKTKQSPITLRGPHVKALSYLHSIVALEEVKENCFDDVLWLNHFGEITEASTSNVFFIGRNGEESFVETPAAESGLLVGITRKKVIDLLEKSNVSCCELVLEANELARFDEAFLSSSVRGLVPIRSINDKVFASTREKSVFNRIRGIFHADIESQVGHRLDWNTGL